MLNEKEKRLIEDNHNLVYSFMKKYRLIPYDDWYDIIIFGLIEAACSYKEDQCTMFSSYSYYCMKSAMVKQLVYEGRRKRVPNKNIYSYDVPLLLEDESSGTFLSLFQDKGQNVEDTVIARMESRKLRDSLDRPMHKKAFDLLEDGYSGNQVAKKLNCSSQNIFQIRQRLRKKYKKNYL